MPIRFLCPACRAAMSAAESEARSVAACPSCGASVRVPHALPQVLEGVPLDPDDAAGPPSSITPPPVRVRRPPEPPASPAPISDSTDDDQAEGDNADDSYYPDDEFAPARPAVSPALVAGGIGALMLLGVVVLLAVAMSSVDGRGEKAKTRRDPRAAPAAATARDREAEALERVAWYATTWFVCMMPFVLILYVIPSIVAFLRNHHNKLAILAMNLLLGWSGVLWVLALVWALTETGAREQVHVHYHRKKRERE